MKICSHLNMYTVRFHSLIDASDPDANAITANRAS